MSDFEGRLTAALTDGAETAPSVVGLAGGARRRAVVRRRRVVVGAVVAVLAVAVPLGVVRSVSDDRGTREVAAAGPGWKTVEYDVEASGGVAEATVLADVPADWVELPVGERCAGFVRWGRPGAADPCLQPESMGFVSERGLLDYASGPGLDRSGRTAARFVGHVSLDQADVTVSTRDEQVALRVLGSVRLEGESIPDLSQVWASIEQDGLDFPVPATGAGEVEIVVDAVGEDTDGPWRSITGLADGRTVRVAAPTVALAQTIGGSSRPAGDGWRTVTHEGIAVDVPPGWRTLDCPGGDILVVAPEARDCDALSSGAVVINGPTISSSALFLDGSSGSVELFGRGSVRVEDLPPATARRILATARPVGTEAPDVSEWETVEVGAGYVADVPVGGAVKVELVEGDADCRPGTSGAIDLDERWLAGYCGDRSVRIVGPTQALTDVVALSVRMVGEVDEPAGEWRTVTVEDVSVDVPPDWRQVDCDRGSDRLQPPGATGCDFGGLGVEFVSEAATKWLGPSLDGDSGSVAAAGQIVSVKGPTLDVVRRILASARPAGTDAPDVTTWRSIEAGDGVTAVVPGDPAVTVTVSGGVPSCRTTRTWAVPAGADRWQVNLCGDHLVQVTAPTQALADVVALQVEGF